MTLGADSELALSLGSHSVFPLLVSLALCSWASSSSWAISQPSAGLVPLAVHRKQGPDATALFWGSGHLSSREVGGPG